MFPSPSKCGVGTITFVKVHSPLELASEVSTSLGIWPCVGGDRCLEQAVNVVVDACFAVVVAVMICCGPKPPQNLASSVVIDRAHPPHSTHSCSVTVFVYMVLATLAVKSPWKPVTIDVKTVVHVGVPDAPATSLVAVADSTGGGVGTGLV